MVSACKDLNNRLGGTDHRHLPVVSSRSEEIHSDGKRIEAHGPLTSRMCYARWARTFFEPGAELLKPLCRRSISEIQ